MGMLRMVVPKNMSNDLRGDFFEKFTGGILSKIRYAVTQRVRFTGMEIDLLAEHKDTREVVFVECKFQVDNIGAGVLTDLIGKAVFRGIRTAFLFTMSDLGKEAKGMVDEYESADSGPVKLVVYRPNKIYEIYLEQHSLVEPSPRDRVSGIGELYCVLSPNSPDYRWVQVILRDGVPERGVVLEERNPVAFSSFVRDLSESSDVELSQLPLEMESVEENTRSPTVEDAEDEVISEISVADSFDDYRPCRPDDYVGRDMLQKEIWEFLESVQEGTTSTRIIAISGASGYGKSSTIIKLADRFKNQKWKGKFYLYDVDVRSARGTFYIHKSIRKAVEAAREEGFISKKAHSADISTISNIFQTPHLQSVLSELRESRKVLVVFFDQFEELFTKVELFSTFETFRRLCHEVDSLKDNIVLGFSWRTGISFNDSHPAYHMWHELDDKRRDFQVRALSSLETSKLITRFENVILQQKLDKVVRRRIAEQSQGLPWLLKKLLVHLGKQIGGGKSQNDLITGRFDVAPLFEEDLERLNEIEVGCLKYIANNSPIDLNSLTEIYPVETVNVLYSRRLIVRSGHKYSVYWDIFRDFLKTGEVPNLPLTYIPKTSPSSVRKMISELDGDRELSFEELIDRTKYTAKSGMNVISDGLMFSLIQKVPSGKYVRNEDLSSDAELRKFLYLQLKEHSVVHRLEAVAKTGVAPDTQVVSGIIDNLHTEEKFSAKSLRGYTNTVLGWLQWASVIAVKNSKVILLEKPDFSSVSASRGRRGSKSESGLPEFLGSSGPVQAVELMSLVASGNMDSETRKKHRNSVADLRALGLLENSEAITFQPTLAKTEMAELKQELYARASRTRLISLTRQGLDRPAGELEQQFSGLIQEIGSNWSHGSVVRYVNSAKRWIKEIDRANA